MDYTEILKMQAKLMCDNMFSVTGIEAYRDPRLAEAMFNAFVIIRNDTRSILLSELMEGRDIVLAHPSVDRKTINDYLECFARAEQIQLPAKMQQG